MSVARRSVRRWLSRFLRRESGNGTIEFVIVVPVFLFLFLQTFELGMILTRQVMLDRGVDLAVRQVRIGAVPQVTHDTLRRMICAGAAVIPDCLNDLKVEMRPVNPRAWRPLDPRPDCIDRNDPARPARTFTPGQSNQLMLLRACALFEPFFPATGIGFRLVGPEGRSFGLTSSSAFVVEPA